MFVHHNFPTCIFSSRSFSYVVSFPPPVHSESLSRVTFSASAVLPFHSTSVRSYPVNTDGSAADESNATINRLVNQSMNQSTKQAVECAAWKYSCGSPLHVRVHVWYAIYSHGQVESVFTLSVSELLDPAFRVVDDLGPRGKVPAFTAGPHRVWGLTAMVIDGVLGKAILPCLRAEVTPASGGEVVVKEPSPRKGTDISSL